VEGVEEAPVRVEVVVVAAPRLVSEEVVLLS